MRPFAGELTSVLHREPFERRPGGVPEAEEGRWRAFRAAYHLAQQYHAPAAFPLQLDFELNSTCQMRCAHCTHGQGTVKKVLLPFDDFARVIDEAASYRLCSIKLNYINEPLLRPDLPRFVQYAKERGVLNVYFATNGLLLTEEVARALIEVGVSKIMVSLDAVTPETYEAMRRSKDLLRIEENIRRLLVLRSALGVEHPAVRVNFLRTRTNAHEEAEFVARWDGVADSIGIQSEVALPGVDEDLPSPAPEGRAFRCSFPFKQLVIDHAGDILPCCTFSGRLMPLGNIATTTIAAAWNSPGMLALQSLHHRALGLTNPICAHCIRGTSP
jgi:radical SAM protein with 4Fe4S-binding SPASM domain